MEPCSRLVVGGWLADRDGVGYYRLRVPLDALERRGHAVEYDTTLRIRPGKRPRSHVLVGQRVSNEGPSRQWMQRAGQVRRVFEIDDDLLNIDAMSGAARAFYNDAQLRARLLENIRSADAVTVSTPYLAEVMRREYGVSAPVHVLPNCLEASVFDLPPVTQAGPMTLGWAGSDTHAGDVEYVRPALQRWFRKHQGVGFTTMGVDYRHRFGAPWGRLREWTPIWPDPVAYMRRLDWQVGLAPLAPTQFNRAKSTLKALEYGARGIVTVASDVEPYRNYIRHGETGFLVSRDHEWAHYLDALAADPALRARMGSAAREQAAEHLIDRWVHLWEAAYQHA